MVAPTHATRYPVRRSLPDHRPAIPSSSVAQLPPFACRPIKPSLPSPLARGAHLSSPRSPAKTTSSPRSSPLSAPPRGNPSRHLQFRAPRTPNNIDSFLALSSPAPSAPSSPSLSASRRHSASLIAKDLTLGRGVCTSFLSLTPDMSPRKPVPPRSFLRLSLKPKPKSVRARKTASSSSTTATTSTTTFSASHSASGIMGSRLGSRPFSLVSGLGNRSSSCSAKTGTTANTGAAGAGGWAEKLPGKVVMGGRPLRGHQYALANPVGA